MGKLLVKNIVVVILLAVAFSVVMADADAKRRSKRDLVPDPKKYAAFVIHTDTGMVLHKKNADKKRHPASLVKMMTLYLTFDAIKNQELSLNSYLYVSARAARQPSLNIGLKKGDKIKTRDAVYALIVRSANDVAVVLAEAIAGSEKEFAKLMEKKAKELGMKNSTFRNASGLYNKRQMTTARDMATLLVSLKKDFPKYYRYMSRTNFMRKGKQYKSHNKVLSTYKGATGGKTGYINASGFNLATAVKRRGSNVVAVVMGGKTSKSRDKIMVTLLDKGFGAIGRVSKRRLKNIANIPVPKLRPWHDTVTVASVSSSPAGDRRLWSIELGGFVKEYEAVNAVTYAMDAASEQLAYSHINFVDKKENGERSHWARFVKLTEQQAKSACQALAVSDTLCKVVDK